LRLWTHRIVIYGLLRLPPHPYALRACPLHSGLLHKHAHLVSARALSYVPHSTALKLPVVIVPHGRCPSLLVVFFFSFSFSISSPCLSRPFVLMLDLSLIPTAPRIILLKSPLCVLVTMVSSKSWLSVACPRATPRRTRSRPFFKSIPMPLLSIPVILRYYVLPEAWRCRRPFSL